MEQDNNEDLNENKNNDINNCENKFFCFFKFQSVLVILFQILNSIFLLLKYFYFLLIYIFLYPLKIIKDNIELLYTKSYRQKKYLRELYKFWIDEYNRSEDINKIETCEESEELSKLLHGKYTGKDCLSVAQYFFKNKMFDLASIFYCKYYSDIFSSEHYYYKAICITEKIRNDFFYTNDKDYISKLYINILRIIAFCLLQISLFLCNDFEIKFDIYKNLGIVLISLNSEMKAEYYFNKAKSIKPNDSLILNDIALLSYSKDKKSNYEQNNSNMANSVKYIHSAMRYSNVYNQEKIFFNLIRILKGYGKNINTNKYKSILRKLKIYDSIYCSYIAKSYEDISEEETLYCLSVISKIIFKTLNQQIADYQYLIKNNFSKKYIKQYKYYMIYNTYLVFYHLNKLDLLKYFILDELKLSSILKANFIVIMESEKNE